MDGNHHDPPFSRVADALWLLRNGAICQSLCRKFAPAVAAVALSPQPLSRTPVLRRHPEILPSRTHHHAGAQNRFALRADLL